MAAENGASTRRAFLVSGSAIGLSVGTGTFAMARGAACTLTPEQEEGPFRVIDVRTCAAIPNATVDIWHCEAMGVYSGYATFDGAPGRPGGPGGFRGPDRAPPDRRGAPPKAKPASGKRFLRGVAATNGDGIARFSTVFPGFYQGRVNHVHLKVRVPGNVGVVHTGQLFFPESIASDISGRIPYSAHSIHRTTLSEDGVYGREHGSFGMGDVRSAGSGSSEALVARLTLVVDRKASPNPVGFSYPRASRHAPAL